MTKKIYMILVIMFFVSSINAQYSLSADKTNITLKDTISKPPADWFLLDSQIDNVRGVSSERAYKELLVGKKSKTVVVGIIDSGIETDHEDLKDVIWINTKEIAGNGVDDDKNGYIDDISGWDFIGNSKGEMIDHDNLEMTRIYVKMKKIFDGKQASDFKGKQLQNFNLYQEVKADFEKEQKEAKQYVDLLENYYQSYLTADELIKKTLNKTEYTIEEVSAIQTEDKDLQNSIQFLSLATALFGSVDNLIEGYEYYKNKLEYNLNEAFDPRSLVGDDYNNLNEKFYGNNLLEGPDAMHGTHVAGIIGANRNNGIGIKGIASDVKIMVLRTVPNGDERDKDVANSIYYAVDNGAKILNMSFGKDYSPYKEAVDKAIQYAEKKGVLMIHAAGNDSRDNDTKKNYPNPAFLNSKKNCSTWIEVGASYYKAGDDFVCSFSNYGQKTVDVFAPGLEIYSTVTDNKYKNLQGTSMAAPMVTGVAALVWSYYPNLTAADLKKILLESAVKYSNEPISVPGKSETSTFGKLSKTGSVINAYEALKMAETYKK